MLHRIRRILVALDVDPDGGALTTGSRYAVDHALELAPALDASVLLFHSTATDEVWDPNTDAYATAREREAGKRTPGLEQAEARLRAAGVSVELALTTETAWLGIIHRVLRDGIDLVIAGKRNENDRRGHRLGSVSMKLLRKCPCAVWVVKPEGAAIPERVLAATDLTPVGERVVEYAAFVADLASADLHVVHSFQRPLHIQLEGEESIANFAKHQSRERLQELKEQVSQAKCSRKASYYVGIDSPTHAILHCQEETDADLVVMGTVSRGGVAGLLVGNTAERLLGRLDCSLLTVKPEDFVCPVAGEPVE